MDTYKTTIGLEVHAELKTKSKMFCGCTNNPHAGEANAYTCPVCLAHPGTLPVVNEEAVAAVVKFGTAVGASIATYSEFDRKNYFYPDIPKAYQISQYAFPFVSGGELAGVKLTRVHLEEDTARSQHDTGVGSIVDFNRAGVPLMELVTEPVIHDSETAGKFARELQLILRTLDISDANMERGEMRVEANISISKDDTLGTKVEVKNLNSFKAVEAAIEYEVRRHQELLEKGEAIIQETRGWDENRSKTFSQRTKETAKDYRYFPDPDIPKMELSKYPRFEKSRIEENMPEMPQIKREKYEHLGLKREAIETIISSRILDSYFAQLVHLAGGEEKLLILSANYLTTDFAPALSETMTNNILSPEHFLGLMKMLAANEVNSRTAKDLIVEFANRDTDLQKVAEERGMLQKSSAEDLLPIVEAIIKENESVVSEYKNGKETALKFLIGQGMKLSKGSANPKLLEDFLKKHL